MSAKFGGPSCDAERRPNLLKGEPHDMVKQECLTAIGGELGDGTTDGFAVCKRLGLGGDRNFGRLALGKLFEPFSAPSPHGHEGDVAGDREGPGSYRSTREVALTSTVHLEKRLLK